MTLAAKRASFCQRMQAVYRVQEVATGNQRKLQTGQTDAEWADYAMSGLLEEAVQAVQETDARQPVEATSLPAKAVPRS